MALWGVLCLSPPGWWRDNVDAIAVFRPELANALHKYIRCGLGLYAVFTASTLIIMILVVCALHGKDVNAIIEDDTYKDGDPQIIAIRRAAIRVFVLIFSVWILFFCFGWKAGCPYILEYALTSVCGCHVALILCVSCLPLIHMAQLSTDRVDAWILKLKEPEPCQRFWLDMYQEHEEYVDLLDKAWYTMAGPLLVFELSLLLAGAFFLGYGAWVCASAHIYCAGIIIALVSLLIAIGSAFSLLPLASVTESGNSLRLLSDRRGASQMPADVHQEYMRFMRHLEAVPLCVKLPGAGVISKETISTNVVNIVRMVPLVLGAAAVFFEVS